MPTRKQRRRRQKDLRHDYEYVYVDDTGEEVEVESEERAKRSQRNGKEPSRAPQKKAAASRRPVREVQPPSIRRVAKRALIFGPLIFLAFSVINSGQALAGRLLVAAIYTLFFIPFMYLMDRAMYRAYLRRSGQSATAKTPARKR